MHVCYFVGCLVILLFMLLYNCFVQYFGLTAFYKVLALRPAACTLYHCMCLLDKIKEYF